MNRCDPAEMHKNLEVVDTLVKQGIDFVCIPVNENKGELIDQCNEALGELLEKNS